MLRQIMPGMRIRVQGEQTGSEESVLASEVRLISYKIHLKPANLTGSAIRSDEAELVFRTGGRTVRLQRWPGGVKLVGVAAKAFQRRGFAALASGTRLQVRGWFLEDNLVLASYIKTLR